MAEKLNVRNLSPVLQIMRNFLLGRKHVPETASLRYSPLVSARTQDPPVLPEGDAHQLSANAYCKRDGRRLAEPPQIISDSTTKQIASGEKALAAKGPVTPGKYWQWD